MSTEQQEILRAKVIMETSRIDWKELQRFFASGVAITVSTELDLVDVALQMHADNKNKIENWLSTGAIEKITDEQAALWLASEAVVWAVVVSPWVLVQEIATMPEH